MRAWAWVWVGAGLAGLLAWGAGPLPGSPFPGAAAASEAGLGQPPAGPPAGPTAPDPAAVGAAPRRADTPDTPDTPDAPPAVAPAVTAVTSERLGGAVRLSFTLDADTPFSLFTLDAPPRVVLDFPRLDWHAGPVAPHSLPGVERLRHGSFRPGTDRIVLDLAAPLAVEGAHMGLAGGGAWRLTLALAPTSPETFAARAGWPEDARWEAPPPEPVAGDLVVALDPGHGGIDPGAVHGGLREKDLVLEIALLLARRLAEEPGLGVVLTRRDDRFVPLRSRLALARAAGANLLLSLHADALTAGRADGASVYTLSERGTDAAAEAFAARENRSDVLAGSDLAGAADDVTRLVIDLARRGTQVESERLAQALLAAFAERVELLDTRPHRQGNFYVLKAPDLPSVLVELGFLSSALDRARLVDPAWRAAFAEAVAAALGAWRQTASPGFLAPRRTTPAGQEAPR